MHTILCVRNNTWQHHNKHKPKELISYTLAGFESVLIITIVVTKLNDFDFAQTQFSIYVHSSCHSCRFRASILSGPPRARVSTTLPHASSGTEIKHIGTLYILLYLVVIKFTFKKITLLIIKLQFNVEHNVYSSQEQVKI